jgi:D-apiose dehydrogenase
MLRGVCVGAGYFSKFQYEAWSRIPEVTITALCNRDEEKGKEMAAEFRVPSFYTSVSEMLDKERPDFVDIITPPETHLEFCREAYKRKINVIVQKPLAPTLEEAKIIVEEAKVAGVRLMVHENFRFQPWYREIKKILLQKIIGETIFSAYFRMRTGDGWTEDAYLNRQPYFRQMPKLLVYETGIHFIDTFRYLFGEVAGVYARLRKLNPVIEGEDSGTVHFEFENGVQAIWDANRYNESSACNPRYTFGEMLIDGNLGSLRLHDNGTISIKKLGMPEQLHTYDATDKNFAGDCVYVTQRHFTDCMINGNSFETSGEDYLINTLVQEAIYASASKINFVNIQDYKNNVKI